MVGALIPNDAIEMATAPGVGPDADALTLGMVEFERASFAISCQESAASARDRSLEYDVRRIGLSWTSYDHDLQDQQGTLSVTVKDVSGSTSRTGLPISQRVNIK